MSRIRSLKHPPITEALIDLRVPDVSVAKEQLDKLASLVARDYPEVVPLKRFEARLDVVDGQPLAAEASEPDLRGYALKSETGEQLVQFRSDGFTLNRLRPYTSWETLLPEARRLWGLFVDVFHPETVSKVAVRYINHVQLDGMRVQLQKSLKSPMPIPEGLTGEMASLLTSVVLYDQRTQNSVRITQSLEPPHQPPNLVMLLDIDAFQAGAWDVANSEAYWSVFEQLHTLKNEVFFKTLTDTALEKLE